MIEVVFFGEFAGLCPDVFFRFAEVGDGQKGKAVFVGDRGSDGADDILIFIRAGGQSRCEVGRAFRKGERCGLGYAHAEAQRASFTPFGFAFEPGNGLVPFLYRIVAFDEFGMINGGKLLHGCLSFLIFFGRMDVRIVIIIDDLEPILEKFGKIRSADGAADMQYKFRLLFQSVHTWVMYGII